MASNRQLAERFAQTLTDHDLAGFAELLHPAYVNHNRYASPGKDGAVAIFAAFLDAFEGFRVDADDVLEAGDSLVGRYTYRGRHTGEFLGIPPSGAEIEMHSIDIWCVPTASWSSTGTSSTALSSSSRSGPHPPWPSPVPHRSYRPATCLARADRRPPARAHHHVARLCRAPG